MPVPVATTTGEMVTVFDVTVGIQVVYVITVVLTGAAVGYGGVLVYMLVA